MSERRTLESKQQKTRNKHKPQKTSSIIKRHTNWSRWTIGLELRLQVCDDRVLGVDRVLVQRFAFLLLRLFKGWQSGSPVVSGLNDAVSKSKGKAIVR
jgi:hypothetical protein